jgi:hypothetical protein
MRAFLSVVTAVLLVGSSAFSATVVAQSGTTCDRACLGSVMTQFLNSMVTHDPKAAPLADKVRFTEDTLEKPVGEGFWKTASKLRAYRTDFLDVKEGTAAVHTVFEENGAPVLFAARLKVVNKRITEIETMVVKSAVLWGPENLKEKSVPMTTMPDKGQLTPRDKMIEIALRYPEGLRIGSFVKSDVPFAAEAYRFENGVRMAGPGCTFQPPGCVDMKNQRLPTLAGMKQRVVAVDEEAGLVLLRLDFGPGSLPGGRGATAGAPQSLVTFEGFKVYGGQVHAVEAIFTAMPQNTPDGWSK